MHEISEEDKQFLAALESGQEMNDDGDVIGPEIKSAEELAKPIDDPKAAPDAEATKDAPADPAPAEAEPAEREHLPIMVADDVTGADQHLNKLFAMKQGLEKKFDSGDLTTVEFVRENSKVDGEIFRTQSAIERAQFVAVNNKVGVENVWRDLVEDYKEQNDELQKPMINAAWDHAVKLLSANEENSSRSMSWFLREAHKMVKAELGLDKPVANTVAPKAGVPSSAREPLPPPRTLASAPAATPNETGQDEFAGLDGLSGHKLTMALARLSDAQRERYMESV